MTTLAAGQTAAVSLRDGGECTVSTNGGMATVTIAPTVGAQSVVSLGPLPARQVFGPYSEGAALTISNQTAQGLDYDQPGGNMVTAEVNPVTGWVVLSAGGVDVPTIGSAYTWAGRPSAALMAGKTARITDLNNTLWISDGAVWRPLNGRAVIAFGCGSVATPLATVAAAPGKLTLPAGANVTAGSVLLPANLLGEGFSVEASVKMRKTGTGGTWAAAARIGTANLVGDSAMVNASGAATTNNDLWLLGQGNVISSGVILSPGFATPNAPTSSAFIDRNTNINTAADMFLSVFATTLNAADTVVLLSYEVSIIG